MAFCSKCGTEVNSGVKFCPNCGNVMEVNNFGGAPVGYAPAKPQMNLNIDFKDPTIMLSLISAVCVLFTFIGSLIFALGDFYEYALDGVPVMNILTMLTFIAPTVLVTLYFLNIGGLGKNNMMITINFASLAAYPLFYLITYIAMDRFTLHTFFFSFGIIAAVAIALYCGMSGFKNKTMFTIALAAAIALEGDIFSEMATMIWAEEYFLVFAVLCSFIARITVYIALLLFVTGKKENA